MNHLSEEELVAHAYGEDAAAAQHLEGCASCGRMLAELKSDLADLGHVEAPPRDEAYGERVWGALRGSLEAYPAPRRKWFAMPVVRGLAYAAACALAVAGAFYAGRVWEHGNAHETAARNPAPLVKQPIVVVVLGDHLDRSERLLVELKHVDAENTEMVSPLRDEARTLLVANKVVRKDAEKSGDAALEGALDHLDHVLNEVANQPGGLNAQAIARLKSEMNTDGLLFEVRVLRSRVRGQKPAGASHLSGGAA